jgi:hypothetical protein
MQLDLPQIDQSGTYQRLATLYTIVFGAAAASFYLALMQSGSNTSLALFAAVAAGLHYGLLRLAGSSVVAEAPELKVKRFTPTSILTHGDLITRIDQLRQEARSSHDELGLMLITLSNSQPKNPAPSPEVMKLVRGELFRAADSRIFQVDERTLAVVECQDDVVLHFDKIALDLQRQLSASQSRMSESAPRATIGVAVATNGRSTAVEMMDNARSAVRLAENNDRDTYFRRVS